MERAEQPRGNNIQDGQNNQYRNQVLDADDRRYQTIRKAILVLGLTGDGKSSFINRFLGINVATVGLGNRSETQQCKDYQTQIQGETYDLIDTPGFGDTHKTFEQTLQDINRFLIDKLRQYNGGYVIQSTLWIVNANSNKAKYQKCFANLIQALIHNVSNNQEVELRLPVEDFLQQILLKHIIIVGSHKYKVYDAISNLIKLSTLKNGQIIKHILWDSVGKLEFGDEISQDYRQQYEENLKADLSKVKISQTQQREVLERIRQSDQDFYDICVQQLKEDFQRQKIELERLIVQTFPIGRQKIQVLYDLINYVEKKQTIIQPDKRVIRDYSLTRQQIIQHLTNDPSYTAEILLERHSQNNQDQNNIPDEIKGRIILSPFTCEQYRTLSQKFQVDDNMLLQTQIYSYLSVCRARNERQNVDSEEFKTRTAIAAIRFSYNHQVISEYQLRFIDDNIIRNLAIVSSGSIIANSIDDVFILGLNAARSGATQAAATGVAEAARVASVTNAFGGLAVLLIQSGFDLREVTRDEKTWTDFWQQFSINATTGATATGMAAAGAAIGTLTGPIGTLIGGLTGGIVGGISGLAFFQKLFNQLIYDRDDKIFAQLQQMALVSIINYALNQQETERLMNQLNNQKVEYINSVRKLQGWNQRIQQCQTIVESICHTLRPEIDLSVYLDKIRLFLDPNNSAITVSSLVRFYEQ